MVFEGCRAGVLHGDADVAHLGVVHEGGGHGGGQEIGSVVDSGERRAVPQNLGAGDEICAPDDYR